MIIGVDFDNTIVCYDEVFYRVALERNLIPANLPSDKSSVRNYLRNIGKEDTWTELQGYVYGIRMGEASPFPGVREFFDHCGVLGHDLRIVSHKTKTPHLGPVYDLHQAARDWLQSQEFEILKNHGHSRIYFEVCREAKLARIRECSCDYFIDDLPEVLEDKAFPENVRRILFDPNNLYTSKTAYRRLRSWSEIQKFLSSTDEYNK